MVDTVLYFEGDRGHTYPHPARRQEPLRRRPTRSACSRWRRRACARSRTPRRCSSATARPRARAPPSSPAWKARGRCWSRSRRWSRPPASARRAARSSAGMRTASRCCSPCSRRAAGVAFAGHDVYLNVAGGLKITEPAADLAAAAALLSSLSGVALPRHRVLFRRGFALGRRQRQSAHGAPPQRGAKAGLSSGRRARRSGELDAARAASSSSSASRI